MKLNARELATVLAALRRWQDDIEENESYFPEYFMDATSLNQDEIDALCERLN